MSGIVNIAEMNTTKSRNIIKNYESVCRIYGQDCELYTEGITKNGIKTRRGKCANE
jgi:3D (Asp-Asp-Asp) domain-containing protein